MSNPLNRLTPAGRRLRVFTWPVHGSYFYYLSHCDCDFYLPYDPGRPGAYGGRGDGSGYTVGPNVHDVPVAAIPDLDFDVILFQTREHYERDQYSLLTEAQRRLPKVVVEHDPPCEHPTDTRHWLADPSALLVHVTDFNRLMWDSGSAPTTVIDHGIVDPGYLYQGTLEKGIVVINNLHSRGRRLGADIYDYVRKRVPVELVGINATEMDGGLGEVKLKELPQFVAQYRFFFNPIRYTSLGLSILEAMMLGSPILGLTTTELVTVIEPGINGWLSLKADELVAQMRRLLDDRELACTWGRNARLTALDRFNIDRFARDWERVFADAVALQTAEYGMASGD